MSRSLTQEAEAAKQRLKEIAEVLELEFKRIRNEDHDTAMPDMRKLLLIYSIATGKDMV